MEEKNQITQMLDLMHRAAFCVENGIITYVNPAATRYLLQPDLALAPLLSTGAEEYATFTEGCLHLTLQLADTHIGATILRHGRTDIIVLEEEQDATQLRTLALAAMELRMPLSNAIATADRMAPLMDASGQEHIAQLNRRMMQMQRLISNMSDCETFDQGNPRSMEYVDIRAMLEELLTHAAENLQVAGIRLEYTLPDQRLDTIAYPQKLERAIYNLLSNAAKFSPNRGVIRVQLLCKGNRLAFCVTDQGPGISDAGNVFTRYLRQPGLEDPRFGLGLGMVLVRSAAKLHGGAVLLDHPEGAGTRVTMTIALNRQKTAEVRSPVMRIDYAGERDHCLLELSDVLPASLYLP